MAIIAASALNPVDPNPIDFDAGARWELCRRLRLQPVADVYDQPGYGPVSCARARYLLSAAFRAGAERRRATANLYPTAFVYEADGIDLQSQWDNITPDGLRHVAVATFSGKKSLHLLVPIAESDGQKIRNNKTFLDCWRHVAGLVFREPQVLDPACATLGRLTRMPGAARPDTGYVQTCIYYAPDAEAYPLGGTIEAAERAQRAEADRLRGEAALARLRHWQSEARHGKAGAAERRRAGAERRYREMLAELAGAEGQRWALLPKVTRLGVLAGATADAVEADCYAACGPGADRRKIRRSVEWAVATFGGAIA